MSDANDTSSGDTDQRYCRNCGYVEPVQGLHPEYGPTDVCPECGPFGPGFFESKESMIEYDHESALLDTGKELTYLSDGGREVDTGREQEAE